MSKESLLSFHQLQVGKPGLLASNTCECRKVGVKWHKKCAEVGVRAKDRSRKVGVVGERRSRKSGAGSWNVDDMSKENGS